MSDVEINPEFVKDAPRAIRVKTSTGWADLAIQGAPGAAGAAGAAGATGPQGPQGPAGAAGPPATLPPQLGNPPAYIANLDICDTTGWYYFDPSTVGRPGDFYGFVQVYAYLGALQTSQIAYLHGSRDVFYRTKPGGSGPGTWIHWFDGGGNLCADVRANTVYSNAEFVANYGQSGQVFVPPYAQPTIEFSPARDTNLFRAAAGVLQTAGKFNAVGGLQVNGVDVGPIPMKLSDGGQQLPGHDFNLANVNGWYYSLPGDANGPPSGQPYYSVHVVLSANNAAYVHQFAYVDYGGPESWWRCNQGGTWTAWRQVTDASGNIVDASLQPRLRAIGPQIADANLGTQNGYYWFGPSTTNAPALGTEPSYGILHVAVLNDPANVRQTVYAYVTNEVWQRRRQDNNWYPWFKVVNADGSNVGAGAASATLAYAERSAAYTCGQSAETNICVTAPSVTLDGATMICVNCDFVGTADSGGNVIYVSLFDNGVNIGRISSNPRGGTPGTRYLTPSAGAHVFAFSVWSGFGDVAMNIGAGGSTIYTPASIRVSKA